VYGYDSDGYFFNVRQYGRDYYAARTVSDGDGGNIDIPASPIYFKSCGIFNTRQPVALSLAVTP
jgi:hypothetical protein